MILAHQYSDLKLEGCMANNILHFGRALRSSGLEIGPSVILDAISAVMSISPRRYTDFYWALYSVFVNKRDQHEIFHEAFTLFWQKPKLIEQLIADIPEHGLINNPDNNSEETSLSQRIVDALELDSEQESKEGVPNDTKIVMSYSPDEAIKTMDFESMSSEEIYLAKKAITSLKMPISHRFTRRYRGDQSGHMVDFRATLRGNLRPGGELLPLKKKKHIKKPPPIVVLCDVSGSMNQYSRMFLHFVHAITNDMDRVSSFIFGTRLTNITRFLHYRDVDVALDLTSEAANDWSGGTRIGECLRIFNFTWSRRVLAQGAVVLLVTDGLDRDDLNILKEEIARLQRSCKKLIWLNPLLRYEDFKPEAGGIRTILPFVDDFRPAHNLQSLIDISNVLSGKVSIVGRGINQ
tara:strand:- start:55215 stop:56435 length:1221 start_codon:yes stop_codon:yes gene_type:complete